MRKPVTAIVLLCLAATGRAQTPIDLDEALRLLRQRNLQLKQQEHRHRIAELEVGVRRGQRLPSLDFSATSAYLDEVAKFDLPPFVTPGRQVRIELGGHDRTDFAIGVRQPIFNGFRLRTQVDLAETARKAEEVRLGLLRQQTSFQLILLYYQAQSLMRERRTQEASLKRLHVQREQIRSLFRAGQVTAFDTLRVVNQALQVEIDIDRNRRDLKLVSLQIARLLDLAQPRPIAEAELPRPSPLSLSLDSLKQVARRRRFERAGVDLALRAARLQRKLLRASYYPSINAELKYHVAKPGLNQVTNEWMDYASVGVLVQWNLWRGEQDRRRIQEAEIEHARLGLEERELLRRIDYEVEKSWENVRSALEQIRLAERLLAQQGERFRIVSAQQRTGVATTNDVLIAEADLTQAELQLQRAIIQYYVSQSELDFAVGSLPESLEIDRRM